MADDVKKLEMRITELENKLKARQAPDISSDDVKAYLKVRDVLHDPERMCGINDCQPCVIQQCIQGCVAQCIQPCIVRCINECTCGPCAGGGFSGGGGGRFGGLGG